MLVRAIVLAVPLALWAASATPAEQSSSQKEGQQMGDSVPGHGHSAGALGGSSDTTGAEGKGGAGTKTGREGSKQETAAGEKGGGTGSGSMDPSGATTPKKSTAKSTGERTTKTKPKAKATTKAQGETPKAQGAEPQGAGTK